MVNVSRTKFGATLVSVVLLAGVAVGCGPDENNATENNQTTNNTTMNNSTENSSTENNATENNATENNATENNATENSTTTVTNAIDAADQTLAEGELNKVVIASVTSDTAAFIVIHEDADGAPGPVIGNAAVPAGESTDVEVTLDRDITDGETLYAMLHVDDPADGEYTFGDDSTQDVPAVDADGNVVVDPFVASTAAANNNPDNSTAGQDTALVSVLHLAAGAGTVDVYVNEGLLIDDLDEKASTNFFPAPAGVSLKLDVVAGDAADNSAPVYSVTLEDGLTRDGTFVVAATGDVTKPAGDDAAFRLIPIGGASSSNDSSDDAKVMVIHGVADAPAVDIVLDNNTAAPLLEDVPFAAYTAGEDGSATYLSLTPGATLLGGPALLDINVADSDGFVAAFQTPDLNALLGESVIVAATGSLADGTFGLTAFVAAEGDTPTTSPGLDLAAAARVQVIHNSADPAAAEVDVYGNGLKLIDNFAFRGATPYITLPSGVALDLNITGTDAADDSDPVIDGPEVTLEPASTSVVIASGVVGAEGDAAFELLLTAGQEALADPAKASVNIHHGSPDTPTVGVRATGAADALVPSLAYKAFTGYVELDASITTVLDIINPAAENATVVQTGAPVSFDFGVPVVILASGSSGLIPDIFTGEPLGIALIAVLPDGTVATVPLVAPAL